MPNIIQNGYVLCIYKYVQLKVKHFLQENDVVVRVIEETKTFGKLQERKNFQIAKKYEHPRDLFVDVKHGKLISILNCQNSYKDLIQIGIEVNSQRLTEKGKVQNDTFPVLTKRIERNESDVRDQIVKNLRKNLEKHQQQGSGWVINSIGNMPVGYFVKTHTMKTYGNFVKWPKGVPGYQHIVNVRTKILVFVSLWLHTSVMKKFKS